MRPNFYEPASVIREVPGVRRRVIDGERDSFVGGAEALIATGILTADMLPGQPGRPVSSATYRPHGAGWRDPGVLHITVVGADRYRVVLGVPLEERERRERTAEASLNDAKRRAEDAGNQVQNEAMVRKKTVEGGWRCLDTSITILGLDAVADRIDRLRSALVPHRRKLPAGWRVIEGRPRGGAPQHADVPAP